MVSAREVAQPTIQSFLPILEALGALQLAVVAAVALGEVAPEEEVPH